VDLVLFRVNIRAHKLQRFIEPRPSEEHELEELPDRGVARCVGVLLAIKLEG
jgi:hypothetical protein